MRGAWTCVILKQNWQDLVVVAAIRFGVPSSFLTRFARVFVTMGAIVSG